MTPSVTLPRGIVVVVALVSVCLLLEGYTPVCSATVREQPYKPFKNIQEIEADIPQFPHLFSVRTLVILHLTSHRSLLPLVEQCFKEVDTPKFSRWKVFSIYNLHVNVKLLLFVQFTPSGFPTSLNFLLLQLPLGYLASHSPLDSNSMLL